MLKLRIAIGAALIACLITVVVGVSEDVRWMTLSYRALISSVIFAICGYVVGGLVESALMRFVASVEKKGSNLDITSEDNGVGATDLISSPYADKEFSPYTPNDYEQISSKE